MSRFLAEAAWAALTHAQAITWGSIAAVAAVCYGLLAVPGWVSDWKLGRRAARLLQAEAEAEALDVTQPIPGPWIMDRRDCGCAVREREALTCPKHAQQQLIDLEAMWQRREDAP